MTARQARRAATHLSIGNDCRLGSPEVDRGQSRSRTRA